MDERRQKIHEKTKQKINTVESIIKLKGYIRVAELPKTLELSPAGVYTFCKNHIETDTRFEFRNLTLPARRKGKEVTASKRGGKVNVRQFKCIVAAEGGEVSQ